MKLWSTVRRLRKPITLIRGIIPARLRRSMRTSTTSWGTTVLPRRTATSGASSNASTLSAKPTSPTGPSTSSKSCRTPISSHLSQAFLWRKISGAPSRFSNSSPVMDSLITGIIRDTEAALADLELPHASDLYQPPAEAERIVCYNDSELARVTSETRQALAADMARLIDHTLLKPEATPAHIRRLCEEARQYNFASVCVNPTFVSL